MVVYTIRNELNILISDANHQAHPNGQLALIKTIKINN